jgi:apolipoprotein N-acyltransferase
MMQRGGKRGLLASSAIVLVAGCAHALSVAWPFGALLTQGQAVWWLQIVAVLLLAWQLERRVSDKQARKNGAKNDVKIGAWLGWMFAIALQCATWWWLFISLHTYGGLASPLAVIAIVGLAAFLGLYYAAACAAFVWLAPSHRAGRAIVFAALWLLAELARVALFTGFPWGEGGYAQLDGPFADLAKLVGVHGLTFGSALTAAAIAGLLLRPRLLSLAAVAAMLVLALTASRALLVEKGAPSAFTSETSRRMKNFRVAKAFPTRLNGTVSNSMPQPPRWSSRLKPPSRCCPASCLKAMPMHCSSALPSPPPGRLKRPRLLAFRSATIRMATPTPSLASSQDTRAQAPGATRFIAMTNTTWYRLANLFTPCSSGI